MQLLTQAQFVSDCLSKYRWEPIPADQQWEEAHFPLPKCSGEGDTVMLWSADHTVQGLLQSVELNHKCFYWKANGKDLLNLQTYYPQYLPLFQQLKSQFSTQQGKKVAELKLGVCGQSAEQMTSNGKKGGEKTVELGVGVHAPGMQSAGGTKAAEMGVGVHAPGMQSAGGTKCAEMGVGAHAPEMRGVGAKKTNAQRYKCLKTGHISNAGPLSHYQKARGINTKLRVKLVIQSLSS